MSKYSVDDLLQEADEAVNNPNWTIATSKRAELYLPGALGAAALGAAAVGGAAALEAAALGGAGALGLGAGALLGPAFAVVAIGLGANAINKRIDCQVKCNTIREKNFEAPRRESEN